MPHRKKSSRIKGAVKTKALKKNPKAKRPPAPAALLPMHVQYFEKGVTYTDRDRALLERKLSKLVRYCSRLKDEASFIRVETERRPTKKERDEVKVMITIELPKKILRAESRRDLPLDAIDRCLEKLEPQVARYKDFHTQVGQARAKRHSRSR